MLLSTSLLVGAPGTRVSGSFHGEVIVSVPFSALPVRIYDDSSSDWNTCAGVLHLNML